MNFGSLQRLPGVRACGECGHVRRIVGHGLCSACYQRQKYRRAKHPDEALKPWLKPRAKNETCPKCGGSNASSPFRTCKDCTRAEQAKDGRKAGGRGRSEGEL